MATLNVPSGAKTDTAGGALSHVVGVGFMGLYVGTKWDDSVFGGKYMLAGHACLG